MALHKYLLFFILVLCENYPLKRFVLFSVCFYDFSSKTRKICANEVHFFSFFCFIRSLAISVAHTFLNCSFCFRESVLSDEDFGDDVETEILGKPTKVSRFNRQI